MLHSEAILQIHTGRLDEANVIKHKGRVFAEMAKLPWSLIVPKIYQWVYLLGVFDYRGDIIVTEEEGSLLYKSDKRTPSLFAISNHEQTHPDLGRIEELKTLIDIIQDNGGKVMLDFVGNHTGLSHPWMTTNPNFYKQHEGKLETQFSGDVAALNYDRPELWPQMMSVLDTIIAWGADGVRCDMAHLVPNGFWKTAISHIKVRYPKFYFLAEAYSESVFNWQPLTDLILAGFDSVYDEFWYRNLKQVYNNGEPWSYPINHLEFLISLKYNFLTHYLANHDDPPIPNSLKHLPALTALITNIGGNILIPQGMLNGLSHRLKHHSLEILEPALSSIEKIPLWYEQLASANQALQPQARNVTVEAEALIKVETETNLGPGVWFFNLGEKPIDISSQYSQFGRGWFKHNPLLKPGAYQLFLAS